MAVHGKLNTTKMFQTASLKIPLGDWQDPVHNAEENTRRTLLEMPKTDNCTELRYIE